VSKWGRVKWRAGIYLALRDMIGLEGECGRWNGLEAWRVVSGWNVVGDVRWKMCGGRYAVGLKRRGGKGALGVQELRKGRWHVISHRSVRLHPRGSKT
jgi:hypothetical protein